MRCVESASHRFSVRLIMLQDDPTRIADIMVEFWRRNERVVVGVKKVGER